MNDTTPALTERLRNRSFPRSSNYDPHWLLENAMGPNVLWLTEWLSQGLPLKPGMRVLDLGCGRAVSSIFLAQEFSVTVCAADYWVKPTENAARIDRAGCTASVLPVFAEAHALPFAEGSFDVILSIDAYHYFGTDDLYLGYISRYLRPGGRLGIVAPGLLADFLAEPPPHLAPYWQWEFCSFHSSAWWQRHWAKTGLVQVDFADSLQDGWQHWLKWSELCATYGHNAAHQAQREAQMLRADAGRTLGFIRIVASK